MYMLITEVAYLTMEAKVPHDILSAGSRKANGMIQNESECLKTGPLLVLST